MPGPQVCVGGCLRVVARGIAVGGRFRGASGTPPPTVCPGMGGSGGLPLIRPCGATFPQWGRQGLLLAAAQGFAGRRGRRPLRFAREWAAAGASPSSGSCGATFPQGGRQGLLLAAAGGRGGVGAPRPTDGDMETLRGLRGHPFPGRRTVGAGHARPGGLRRPPSMVRSVGRGLDPSAGGCPGDGRWREVSRGVGDATPYGLPGNERQREPAPHPALRGHLPPRGKARAVIGGSGSLPRTPAAGPRCGAGGSGCSTSGLTKPAQYRRNPGRCRGGSRR